MRVEAWMHFWRANSEGEKEAELRLEPRGMSTLNRWLQQRRPTQGVDYAMVGGKLGGKNLCQERYFKEGVIMPLKYSQGLQQHKNKICLLFESSLLVTLSSFGEGENHAGADEEWSWVMAIGLLSLNIWRDRMKTKALVPICFTSTGQNNGQCEVMLCYILADMNSN